LDGRKGKLRRPESGASAGGLGFGPWQCIRRKLELDCRKGKLSIYKTTRWSVGRGFGARSCSRQSLGERLGIRHSPARPIFSACWLETGCTKRPQWRYFG
jgi:hypothetical protein